MATLYKWVGDNSLSITFFLLFLLTLLAQTWIGLASYNDLLHSHGFPPVRYWPYLGTGDFLDGIFSNWQAAILQLACLILFSGVLRQRGASHSLKADGDPGKNTPDTANRSAQKTSAGTTRGRSASKKRAARKTGRRKEENGQQESWLYCHSLSLAFGAPFLVSLIAHLIFGTWQFNETSAMAGQSTVSISTFAHSATFWFRTVQTWEAEFGVIGVFIVLSIFLREQGSAESKPVESTDEETGETNK